MKGRDWTRIGICVVLSYSALSLFVGPDLKDFLFPWLSHIREAGPVGAFSVPFSNYTPPYLYLLAASSLLGLPPLATIKLLSVLGTLWLALAVRHLLSTLRSERANEAAALSLLIPSVSLNGPLLGQCDAMWVGCCLFAVASAIEKRTYRMAAWAGLAFAFKAQAVFVAPFALAIVLRERRWAALLIPPAVYFLAVVPAWIAGWPLSSLFTIYLRQFALNDLLSTAPNLWAIPAALFPNPPSALFTIGYALGAAAAAVFVRQFRPPLLRAALLSSLLLPFLLPNMLERYFLLADLLSFCLAYLDPRTVRIFLCVQAGSLLSLLAYTFNAPLNVVGSVFMTYALIQVGMSEWRGRPEDDDHGVTPGAPTFV